MDFSLQVDVSRRLSSLTTASKRMWEWAQRLFSDTVSSRFRSRANKERNDSDYCQSKPKKSLATWILWRIISVISTAGTSYSWNISVQKAVVLEQLVSCYLWFLQFTEFFLPELVMCLCKGGCLPWMKTVLREPSRGKKKIPIQPNIRAPLSE